MKQRLLVGLLAGTLGCTGGLVSIGGQTFLDRNDSPAAVVEERPSDNPPPAVNEPQPVSAAEYQRVLTALDAQLRQEVQRLTSGQVNTARLRLVSALRSQAEAAESTTPPPAVASAHVQLLSALRTAAAELENLTVNGAFCGGPPATIRRIHEVLTRNGTGLTHAAAALRAHRLSAGTFLPRRPDAKPRRGPNGWIYRSGKRGNGKLVVDNNGSRDVAVSVVTGKPSQPQIMMYVRARSTARVSGVRGSVYHLYLKGGVDWDGARRQFTTTCTFEKFDQAFTQRSYPYITTWTITLNAAKGAGRTTTSSNVDPY